MLKPGEAATEKDIIEWCKKDLAGYKVPKEVEFRNALPRSSALKVLRRELIREHLEKA